MDLEHAFTVPVGVEAAWAEFQDIASVAECFPGAQVTEVDGESFHGTVKVKLGPIALLYNGSGTFAEKDEANHRLVVDARGKDKRGNGTAGAMVTMTMTGNGDATDINVHTDLTITGKPAQFGRGVMQDVSDKLLGQFVGCLEQRLGNDGESATPAAAPPTAGPETPVAEPPAGSDADSVATPVSPAAPPPAATPRPAATSARGPDDALDLGRTVLPVLVKNYWKQALVAVVVIAVVVWLVTR